MRQGRSLPYSNEAEMGVLGGVLIDNHTLDEVSARLKPDDFYAMAHAHIFEAMTGLDHGGQAIDMITLGTALEAKGVFEKCGGHSYLSRLIDATPSTANIDRHAAIVAATARRRRAITALEAAQATLYEGGQDTDAQLDDVERIVLEATGERGVPGGAVEHLGEVAYRVATEATDHTTPRERGVPSGFSDLDRLTGGFHPGDLVVVAARPAMGKTAFSAALVLNAARRGHPGLICSLEMAREQIAMRALASEAQVPMQTIRLGQLGPEAEHDLFEAGIRLGNLPVLVDDRPGLSVGRVRAGARRARARFNGRLSLLVVDYLQLLRSAGVDGGRRGKWGDNREREVAEISRALKETAKELGIPVIALSQLNRGLESRQDKRPNLGDLRESGAIEADADLVLFLYRDEVYHPNSTDTGIVEVIIGKQRNGPVGNVRLHFDAATQRFLPLARPDQTEGRYMQ